MNLTQEQINQFKQAINAKNYYFVYRFFMADLGKVIRDENGLLYIYNINHYELLEEQTIKYALFNFIVSTEVNCPEKIRTRIIDEITEIIIGSPEYPKVIMNNEENYLFFKNGSFNLDALEFKEPDNKLYNTFYIDIDFDWSKKECPNMEKFMGQVFIDEKGNPDQKQIAKEYMKLGYFLYPLHKMEKIFIYIGGTLNGKSVYFEIIQNFFPKQFISFLPLEDIIAGGLERTELLSSYLNIAQEFEADYFKSMEFKKVISGQEITIKRKFKQAITIKPKAKLIVALNDYPEFTDKSKAITRRLDITEMNAKFVEEEEYSNYKNAQSQKIFLAKEKDNIIREILPEKSAILNHLISGLLELKKRGWAMPVLESNKLALQEFEENNNPLAGFLLGRYEFCEESEKMISPSYIYDDCEHAGIEIKGESRRSKEMHLAKTIRQNFNTKSYPVRRGLSVERLYPLTLKQTYVDLSKEEIL